ncbi:hypothetical protein MYX77_14705, partial [Acidobacteriia bacterium AH_259_A11_L15]|nr:hypothetical protein [Acidobacteriia bacterium AH_259_A11_L15]
YNSGLDSSGQKTAIRILQADVAIAVQTVKVVLDFASPRIFKQFPTKSRPPVKMQCPVNCPAARTLARR